MAHNTPEIEGVVFIIFRLVDVEKYFGHEAFDDITFFLKTPAFSSGSFVFWFKQKYLPDGGVRRSRARVQLCDHLTGGKEYVRYCIKKKGVVKGNRENQGNYPTISIDLSPSMVKKV